MRKKILSMSVAAIVTALTSPSVMAFDTDDTDASSTAGPILVQNITRSAAYEGDILPTFATHVLHSPKPSAADLKIAENGRGDALIFPLFNQAGDWGTEIVVRNTDQDHAIVAKVSVYANDDSQEVLDFNVYLSASDVVRFKIENGNLISEDGSVLRDFPAPSSNLDNVDADDFASVDKPFTRPLNINSGYIVVYGMGQASTDPSNAHSKSYHKDHAGLFKNYRKELDVCRPGWRVGHANAMVNGTYIRNTILVTNPNTGNHTYSSVENYSVASPNQAVDCGTAAGTTAVAGNFFGDVAPSLTGTVRLYSSTSGERDMMLPAKAIENFTVDNKIIYTEGEIAGLHDRRIQGVDNTATATAWATYDEVGIKKDAQEFLVDSTTYTFAANSVANKLSITQPYKRALVQLGNDDGYWKNVGGSTDFGGFSFIYNVFNEHEDLDNTPYTQSPYNSGITVLTNELESMADLESGSEFDGKNGYALVHFIDAGGQKSGIPAIITQMIGTTAGTAPQLNWIYSQTN